MSEDCGLCVTLVGVNEHMRDYPVAIECLAIGKVRIRLTSIGGCIVPRRPTQSLFSWRNDEGPKSSVEPLGYWFLPAALTQLHLGKFFKILWLGTKWWKLSLVIFPKKALVGKGPLRSTPTFDVWVLWIRHFYKDEKGKIRMKL
jgi:hypothetical protein